MAWGRICFSLRVFITRSLVSTRGFAMAQPKKVALVGSGSWASVIARIIAPNTKKHREIFQEEVTMYVYEEMIGDRKLTDILNTEHENVKYLPGYKIPENVVANPDVVDSVKDADVLLFVVPHQFLRGICQSIQGSIKPDVIGISLVKGLDHANKGLTLVSSVIKECLSINVSVLMGANLARELADEQFGEATIGCRTEAHAPILKDLFHTDYFQVKVVQDADTVELCGALKNVVALGVGFVDALGYGDNTKSAIIRIGLKEMIEFTQRFYEGVKLETFLESCGVADLITTCYGGRNRRAGQEFVKGKSFKEVEEQILGGQMLQGPHTAYEAYQILKENNLEDGFPLFTSIYNICFEKHNPKEMIECLMKHPK